MANKSPLINVMERAARKAGRGLIRDFGEVEQLQVSPKGTGDFVSTADLKADALLREDLTHARPDFGTLIEESGATESPDGEHRWIVDPLDGTINFLHGIPHFCISIAVERSFSSAGRTKTEIIAGLVYDPVHDDSYWSDKSHGAFLNDRRLRVSGRRKLREAMIGTGLPAPDRSDPPAFLAQNAALTGINVGIRRMGSAALDLAYVAAGRFDGYWQEGLQPWDMAAGILLVREAGGFISEVNGKADMIKSGSIVAANDHLHEELRGILQDAGSGDA
jgi:myo-inositol-1(or 4)-monophosphatase